MGEEKDEAIDGKEWTPNNDLSKPADFVAWEGINGDFTMVQPLPPTEMVDNSYCEQAEQAHQ